MNFYKRYMGDYGRDTAHLSLAEHGAYTLLLDHYYSTEGALPAELAALYRVCRAFDKNEQRAVASVANAYFPVGPDGLRHNERADRQIPEDVRLIETARANGKKGGRPPKATQQESKKKPTENPAGFQNGTETEPRTKTHQTPDSRQEHESANADLPPAGPAPPRRPPCPQQAIVALYHETLPELRQVREWNQTRQKLLARRWAESPKRQSLDWWRQFFGYVRRSRFLMGQTQGREGRPFDCDLEWLIRPTNFAKVVEGRYEDQAA